MDSIELISSHILSGLSQIAHRPLFVGIQGPQGSGKSYVTSKVQRALSDSPSCLRVVALSIDDLYLPHSSLASLAAEHQDNPLWRGRGQPGTHDVELGRQILTALRQGQPVELPRFDKSLFNGEGDRLPMDGTGTLGKPPIDVVILEGWCTGFYPISEAKLATIWDSTWKTVYRELDLNEDNVGNKDNILEINRKLYEYIPIWSFLDVFVQLKPAPSVETETSQYSIIYKWRLQQEHDMKAKNGGKGMTDGAVKEFVDRYIPGYVFFGEGVIQGCGLRTGLQDSGPPRWLGHGVRLFVNQDRDVVDVERF